MKINLAKSVRAGSACPLFTAAAIVLAMAFTFGCSDDTGGGSSGGGGGTPNGGGGGGNCPNAVTTPVNAQGIGSVSCGGKTYKTVKIGTQTWMAENLNFNAEGSKCGGNDHSLSDANTATCDNYGRLYNWSTAMGISSSYDTTRYNPSSSTKYRGVCPSGWHIPSGADWNILMKFANTSCIDNDHCEGAGTKLKASSGWNDYEGNSGNGTDDYGFSALPGGSSTSGGFWNVGFAGNWWGSSEYNNIYAYSREMRYNSERASLYYDFKKEFLSIRCIQD